MNFDIKDLKSWANRHGVKTKSVTGFFGNSLLEIDNEIRRYNKGEKGHLHKLYQISDNGCFCFGYATYFADTGAFGGTNNFAFFLPLDAVKKDKISDDTSVPNYHLTENKMKHTENTRINQFLSDLSLTEATIILQSLLALNHKLLDELADYANTASYDHFEVTKDSLVAVSSMIDKLTSVYDVKLMEKEEE